MHPRRHARARARARTPRFTCLSGALRAPRLRVVPSRPALEPGARIVPYPPPPRRALPRLRLGAAPRGLLPVVERLAETPATRAASASAATGKKPAPFSKGTVKVALVRQSGAGDYFEQWGNGAKAQAKALGIDLTVYDAQADNAKQATDLSSADQLRRAGDHRRPRLPGHDPARDRQGGRRRASRSSSTTSRQRQRKASSAPSRTTPSMAQAVLDVMAKDSSATDAKVGYVNVAGYRRPRQARHRLEVDGRRATAGSRQFKVGKVHRLHRHRQRARWSPPRSPQHSDVTRRLRPVRRAGQGHRPRRRRTRSSRTR